MKKSILVFLVFFGFNFLTAQINNNVENPNVAPNSGVQTPPPGVQTTGPDFQPTTPYIQTIPPIATPTLSIPTPSVPETQPNTNTITPNSFGTDNLLNANPTNTLSPGTPSSPPKN